MTPKCAACPITGECKSYEHLCGKMATDPERYRHILDSVNRPEGQDDEPTSEDRALQAYVAEHGCGPCH